MKYLQGFDLLTHADELDRLPHHRLQGKGCASAGVAVHLRHDHAVDAQQLVEPGRHVHGVLPRHGVSDKQDLRGVDHVLDPLQLFHHLVVNVEPARRIHKDDLVSAAPGILDRLNADPDGIGRSPGVMDSGADLLTENTQLFHCRRAVDVRGYQINLPVLAADQPGQLDGRGRLAAALETDQHDGRGNAAAEAQLAAGPPHEFDKTVVHDFHDLLAGRNAVQHLLPHRPDTHVLDEVLDDLEIHIGLEQGHADLPERPLNILLVQPAFSLQLLENTVQFFRQIFKHDGSDFPLNRIFGSPIAQGCEALSDERTTQLSPLMLLEILSAAFWASSRV